MSRASAPRASGTANRPPTSGISKRLIVLVDAENVRRSTWPNIPSDELVALCAAWAEREAVEVEVVFEGIESADDQIASRARELTAEGRSYRLVTSDRELRARAGEAAESMVGGGSFAQTLRSL